MSEPSRSGERSPSEPPSSVTEFAPAKINLDLHVLGRRPDGYHELDSLIVFAEIGDRVRVERYARLELILEGPFAGALRTGEPNLVVRAAQLLAQAAGRAPALRLVLEKRLPVAAGLGGGSADAAATLRALMRLWSFAPHPALLEAICKDLGADVPACFHSRPLRLRGLGERLELLERWPVLHLVLVNPNLPLATAQVFAERAMEEAGPRGSGPWAGDREGVAVDLARSRNDLEPAAQRLRPVIGDVLVEIGAADDCLVARMSGSGPTCFGLFASDEAAFEAARQLQLAHPAWWIVATRTQGSGPEAACGAGDVQR